MCSVEHGEVVGVHRDICGQCAHRWTVRRNPHEHIQSRSLGAMRGLNKWVAALNVASMSCWCWAVSCDETPLRGMSVWRCVWVCVDRFLLIAHLA